MGYPGDTPSNPGSLPPGGGKYTVPNFLSFAALVRSASKAFLYSSDEALRDSPTNARVMKRDPVLWGALLRVWRPIAQLGWSLEPEDETNPAEVEAARMIEYCIKKTPHFQRLKMYLLQAIWYGKYAVELAYEWRNYRGEEKIFVRDFTPINGDKLRLKWDAKTWGVLVYPGYPGEKVATDWGLCHFLNPDERIQYIIHQHEPDDADFYEPELAGSIGGVGVRGRLYWFWWLKQQVFGQLMNYIHRFANGLTIFYYDASNPAALNQAQMAARAQFSNTVLLYPRWNGTNPDVNKVERLEVGSASSSILYQLVNDYFDPKMERFIEGQTLSSNTDATGMGSGVARQHGETLDEVIKYHAVDLQETLQSDFINVLYAYNAPGVTPGTFSFNVDDPNANELMEHADQLFRMGVPLDEDQVYEVSQWRKPALGSGIVSQVGSMQAQMPQQPSPIGVPQIGQPGPDQQGQDPNQQQQVPNGQPQQMSRLYRGSNGKLTTKFNRVDYDRIKNIPTPISLLLKKRLSRKKVVFS
ncbi:unnamed protein product [Sphagnum balticum]